ncbi:DUF1056 domain-containing protein [Brevibacillus laterosporus]|uniref:Uncharacterized protein n=2 Tax=Brevibacillus TaxID=55080 RepID=A0A0F6XYW5_BRELA|nr:MULTISPECIES: hypothetical protein [Brevibacillus]AKF92736.1 hypothetical protein EX87_02895 [Brevibacillus laterosporus]MCR8985990.1 DUF1056 domain-containing protein [Brevibacillus laterosporus]MCZ0831723.1 DUF1056 domain-containing protein [Brevibacillus halotolerans]
MKFIQFLCLFIEDILILSGCACITTATYLLNGIAGLYVSGVFLCLLGFLIGKKLSEVPERRR